MTYDQWCRDQATRINSESGRDAMRGDLYKRLYVMPPVGAEWSLVVLAHEPPPGHIAELPFSPASTPYSAMPSMLRHHCRDIAIMPAG